MRLMNGYDTLYWSNHFWTAMAVLSAVIVVVSSLADRRRYRRSNIEAVGFMPWTAITVMSVLATVLSIALAIKSG
jgi:hypothetical protein